MRAGHQTGADIDRFGGSFSRRHGHCALHADPQLVALLTQHESDAVVGEHDIVKVSLDRVCCRNLRHRPVITPVPTPELILVT